jgi:hypothetical protein
VVGWHYARDGEDSVAVAAQGAGEAHERFELGAHRPSDPGGQMRGCLGWILELVEGTELLLSR